MHFYGTPDQAPARLAEFSTTLAQAGVTNRPIWVTEAGLPSDPSLNATGAEGQADWLQMTLPALLAAGASRVFWFQLYDTAWDTRGFGLLDSSLSPRPAFASLAELALQV